MLDADLPLAIDVLSDMVTASLIEPKDVDAGVGVILEEIAMNDDDPTDTVHEAFAAQLFGDTPLGRPILGSVDSINSITREQIAEHYAARYTPDNLVIAAAGSLDRRGGGRSRGGAFRGRGGGGPGMPRRCRRGCRRATRPAVIPAPGSGRLAGGIEQANLVLGCEGLSRTDDRRFALGVLNAALGGGMSSRLFQEVREKRGLAYSVYSFSSQHADTGMWGVYAGCLPAKADEVLADAGGEEIAKSSTAG